MALGVIVTVAVPSIVVNDGIEVTSVTSANPIAEPPLISNVTPLGVPVKVMADAVFPVQYVVADSDVATVGVGLTVTVAVPLCVCEQLLASCTLTKV